LALPLIPAGRQQNSLDVVKGEQLLSLGIAGKPGNADGQFNQPSAVIVGPDGSICLRIQEILEFVAVEATDRTDAAALSARIPAGFSKSPAGLPLSLLIFMLYRRV
jgi:hypothetical protein